MKLQPTTNRKSSRQWPTV